MYQEQSPASGAMLPWGLPSSSLRQESVNNNVVLKEYSGAAVADSIRKILSDRDWS